MKNQPTQALQKSLSKVFPDNRVQLLAEILFLMISGIIGIVLHAKLKVPLHLPGKQGLLFMFIIIGMSQLSRFRFSTLLATSGSALLLLTGYGGFEDPFMPLHYLLLGLIMDLLMSPDSVKTKAPWYLGVAGGLAYAVIPFDRAIITLVTGLPFHSLMNGIVFPVFTHFLFGFFGSFLAGMAVKTLSEK